MRHLYIIPILILFLFIGCKKESENSPSITMLSSYDGLPDNWVYCIAEDHFGNIWIGTENGVGKFDGMQCQSYFDTLSYFSNRVVDIIVDNSGDVWFKFLMDFENLYKYNGVNIEKTKSFIDLYKNLDSTINYYYSNHKIYQYKDNGFEEIEIPLDNNDKCFVNQVLKDTKGNFWVSTNGYCMKGLLKFDGVKWTEYDAIHVVDNAILGDNLDGMIESDNGSIMYSNGNSICQFNGINISTIYDYRTYHGDPIINCGLFEDSKTNIWFGLDRVYKFNRSKVQEIDISSFPKHGIYGRVINTFFEDSKGNIWIGTGNGLFIIK